MPKVRTIKRNEDGLFQTYCLTCEAVIWNATDNEPHPNCENCPGHDEIARINQESADKESEDKGDDTNG